MGSSSEYTNHHGDVQPKPSHRHSSKDSKKTQAKRRQSMFENSPESSAYYVSGQATNVRSSKSQHKKSIKGKMTQFDEQFGSKS